MDLLLLLNHVVQVVHAQLAETLVASVAVEHQTLLLVVVLRVEVTTLELNFVDLQLRAVL